MMKYRNQPVMTALDALVIAIGLAVGAATMALSLAVAMGIIGL